MAHSKAGCYGTANNARGELSGKQILLTVGANLPEADSDTRHVDGTVPEEMPVK